MPELPEVETIHRQIVEKLGVPASKEDYQQNWQMTVDYYHLMGGRRTTPLVRTQRKGKNIVFYGSEYRVHTHLRMSGRIHILHNPTSSGEEVASAFRHCKMVMLMSCVSVPDRSFRMAFTDTRGFGVYSMTPSSNPWLDINEIRRLGIDPTYPDEWTLYNFNKALLRFPRMPVGSVIMRQDVVAGIGNIYRSEILHYAGVNPLRAVHELTNDEIETIFSSISQILTKAIELRGTSIAGGHSTYRDASGQRGDMVSQLAVYQRDGLTCRNCGVGVIRSFDIEKLRRIYYCPECQI